MSHWLPAEPGWRDVADLSLAWLAQAEAKAAGKLTVARPTEPMRTDRRSTAHIPKP